MLTRREFAGVAAATAALMPGASLRTLAQGQRLTESDLLRFPAKGQVTLLHMTDCHAQLMPVYFREPSVNLGVGEAKGLPPHISGRAFLAHFNIAPGSPHAYALSSDDFTALAHAYGKIGGMDRMARLIGAIRAERGAERVLLLDGGDTLQGSYTALHSTGADMVRVMDALGIAATTGHWDFTLGDKRVTEIFGDKDKRGQAKAQFLAGNIVDDDFQEQVFKPWTLFETGGVTIGVIGQAFPFTPIANPRWMMPKWSFGIREPAIRRHVAAVRRAGAQIVVLLSHNGFDVDRKLALRVPGLDVILTAHTHDAIPVPIKVGSSLLIATGYSTKFLSRLDLDVQGGRVVDHSFALIPLLADAIAPDPAMAALIKDIRAPHEAMLSTPLARSESLLYRRGNFAGTFDDLICDAILAERDAEIALSPGFRWGGSVLPGQDITWDDLYSATAMTYPNVYRVTMTGHQLKDILEDVCDNLFHPDPYYQQGGDMVRVGGMGFSIDVGESMGRRIGAMTHLKSGQAIEPNRRYTVAGWASVFENTEGPPVWDLVAAHLRKRGTVTVGPNTSVKVAGG